MAAETIWGRRASWIEQGAVKSEPHGTGVVATLPGDRRSILELKDRGADREFCLGGYYGLPGRDVFSNWTSRGCRLGRCGESRKILQSHPGGVRMMNVSGDRRGRGSLGRDVGIGVWPWNGQIDPGRAREQLQVTFVRSRRAPRWTKTLKFSRRARESVRDMGQTLRRACDRSKNARR